MSDPSALARSLRDEKIKELTTKLWIEYHKLEELLRAPRNPKSHDLGALHASIDWFGYISPFIMNDRTGRLLAGHGRLDVLQQKKARGEKPPRNIYEDHGSWYVPVVHGLSFDDETAEAYVVADNKTTILGGWDDYQLSQVLADIASHGNLEATGYTNEELDELLASLGHQNNPSKSSESDEDSSESIWQVLTVPVPPTVLSRWEKAKLEYEKGGQMPWRIIDEVLEELGY